MIWNKLATPEEVFRFHYMEILNPATPVIVGYGWSVEGTVAWELSRNEGGTRWALTFVTYYDRGRHEAPKTWLSNAQVFNSQKEAEEYLDNHTP
jgi:hypothetical protein